MADSRYWSAEQTARLRIMLRAGYTYKQISEELDVTKNAVIGRVNRLNIHYPAGEKRKSQQKVSKKVKDLKKRSERWAFLTSDSKAFVKHVNPQASAHTDWTQEPPSLYVDFESLDGHHCRYIHGDPKKGNHHFCGHMQYSLGPYCEFHASVCFSKLKRKPGPDERGKPEMAKTKRV